MEPQARLAIGALNLLMVAQMRLKVVLNLLKGHLKRAILAPNPLLRGPVMSPGPKQLILLLVHPILSNLPVSQASLPIQVSMPLQILLPQNLVVTQVETHLLALLVIVHSCQVQVGLV